ncbi:subtilisin-like protease SBT4.3 [Daucus carota subsp. sativus]|uniref:subtilisin-like protease SBT4.3 n=1 Tax=Daucus carota subsp. sativus TaxID=79200 RepID=UPI0007EFDA22|nr:PREDICTED: subtilisin-like protease SBT4.3 [Daucus carota subsp. sativus]
MAWAQLLCFLCLVYLSAFVCNCHEEKKVHVVYMGDLPQGGESLQSTHHNILHDVLGSHSLAKEALLHSYQRSFNGFVAKLADAEVAKLRAAKGVVSVFPNRRLQLHTTRSWDFLGLPRSDPLKPTEGNVIVGMLDTGLWPESKSFQDESLGAPPSKWKGTCQATNFTCNNKVIGGRYYDIANMSVPGADIRSPRDAEGHGSHTSSTVAGQEVQNASFYGIGEGIARGGVPSARIAVYKVCWSFGCNDVDILAAFDDAIADGVDILSVSLGSNTATPYDKDSISIGSFHAMKKGILTSCAAGNSGPYRRMVSNYYPWALTVAASTMDRKLVTKVVLGDGQTFVGTSLNGFTPNATAFPLVYSGDVNNVTFGVGPEMSKLCLWGTLSSKAEGGIVLCDVTYDGAAARMAGAAGIIMPISYFETAFAFSVPAVLISYEDHAKLFDYIRTTETPIATILHTEEFKDVMAPLVAAFSSRGPNPISPEILKPDITAPGANILAAWSPLALASLDIFDSRRVDYNIISGTSMACPHATGAAAYVKASHPDWSPAAIKSALMTTATIMDPRKNADAEFAYGSGQINPMKAVDPGLVFDASESDYVDFLCNEGYNTSLVRLISGDSSNCSTPGKTWDLNYPSFALSLLDGEEVSASYTRTVTNVGCPNSTYSYEAFLPPSFNVTVEPEVLTFTEVGEKKSFTLNIVGPPMVQVPIVSGSLVWTDGNYTIRSPIVIFNDMPTSFLTSTESTQKQNSLVKKVLELPQGQKYMNKLQPVPMTRITVPGKYLA